MEDGDGVVVLAVAVHGAAPLAQCDSDRRLRAFGKDGFGTDGGGVPQAVDSASTTARGSGGPEGSCGRRW
uniref:Uncharacterized protein n=1 Tax=Leersia perrieri TaxID=77586 RepID=A0A0D9VIK7_9ORYZ